MKGLGKGGAKRHRKILRDNIQGNSRIPLSFLSHALTLGRYYQASYPSSGPSWWCQAYLGLNLRRNSWCSQDIPRERERITLFPVVVSNIFPGHSRLCDLHGTCQAENCHRFGRRLCPQAVGAHVVWLWGLGNSFRTAILYFVPLIRFPPPPDFTSSSVRVIRAESRRVIVVKVFRGSVTVSPGMPVPLNETSSGLIHER